MFEILMEVTLVNTAITSSKNTKTCKNNKISLLAQWILQCISGSQMNFSQLFVYTFTTTISYNTMLLLCNCYANCNIAIRTMPFPILPAAFVLFPTASPHQPLPLHLPTMELPCVGGTTDTKHLVPVTFYLAVLKHSLEVASIFHYQLTVT